jgi:excisionase family DNA binding protein
MSGLAAQVSPPHEFPDLSLAEAASVLGVNVKTVRRAIAEGRLPAYRVGKLIRVRSEDVAGLFTRIPTAGIR